MQQTGHADARRGARAWLAMRVAVGGGVALAGFGCATPRPKVDRLDSPVLLAARDATTCWAPPMSAEIRCWRGASPSGQPSFRVPFARRPELIDVVDGGVCARTDGAWACWSDDVSPRPAPPVWTDAMSAMEDVTCSLRDGTARCSSGDQRVDVSGVTAFASSTTETCVIVAGEVRCVWSRGGLSEWSALLPALGGAPLRPPSAKLVAGAPWQGCSWDGMALSCWRVGSSVSQPRWELDVTTPPGDVVAITIETETCVLTAGGDVHCSLWPGRAGWRHVASRATALVAGSSHTCAALHDRQLMCWGGVGEGPR